MSTALAEPMTPATPAAETEEEPLYEIIDGQRKDLPPMSAYATIVASRLGNKLSAFGEQHGLGEAVVEVLFGLPLPISRNRRPDLAFVSYQRWPRERPIPLADNAWDVVPDLAVEVISPQDLVDELMQKIGEYFQAKVRLVWVIYPPQRLVHVYESLTEIHVRTQTDELDGGAVLPGFHIPVASLFPEAVASA